MKAKSTEIWLRASAVIVITASAWLQTPAIAQANPSASPPRVLPSDKYEQPRYTVIKQAGSAELREYAPMLLAEVTLEGSREQTLRDGFRILAGYIFGGNTRRASIAMTSPVTQAELPPSSGEKIAMTSPVLQQPEGTGIAGENRFTVAFMLPSNYTLETIPRPNDKRVQFRLTEPQRRATIRFSGAGSPANLATHRQQLLEFVAANGWKTSGELQWAQYDDPFTLPWNRRNEWWVAVQ